MAKYMRKPKAAPELPAMEMGPLTRARKMALLEETTAPAVSVDGKRRKVVGPDFRPRKKRPAVALSSDVRSVGPRCSSGNDGGLCEVEAKGSAADLEVVIAGGIAAAAGTRSGHRRGASLTEADELECPATTTAPEAIKYPAGSQDAPASEMPPADEMNAFFVAAEEKERARFADKYNFDVEKDVPVEGGRYEWVRLK